MKETVFAINLTKRLVISKHVYWNQIKIKLIIVTLMMDIFKKKLRDNLMKNQFANNVTMEKFIIQLTKIAMLIIQC